MTIRNHTFHGLQMVTKDTLDEAIEDYLMGFDVTAIPAFFDWLSDKLDDEGDPIIEKRLNPEKVTVVRTDTGGYLGTVGLRYETVNYMAAFSLAEPLLKGGAKIVGGGCPNRGERAYLVLESPGIVTLAPGDTIVNRFIITSSHDGTGKIEVRMTPWREKTGTAITTDAASPVAFKHTRNVSARVTQARKVFTSVNKRWDEFSEGVQRMLAYPLSEKDAKDFINNVLPTTTIGAEPSTRLENIRSEIFTIYRDTGIGTRLPNCRNTLFGVVQAFVEWADIKRTVRKSTRRDEISAMLDARLVSDSAKKKQKAWAMALYLSKQNQLSGSLNR